jgi:GNAT superfamily N-acetyltransferase
MLRPFFCHQQMAYEGFPPRHSVFISANMSPFTHRIATLDDLPALHALMGRAIAQLQHGFLDPAQIAVSHKVMGLDTQLVLDGTYLVLEEAGTIVGCGGWSWRSTLFGGDESIVARAPTALDPAKDAAKIRAMYTEPAHARRGIGTLVITLCEDAARAAGFSRTELMATAAGVPLYEKVGYRPSGAPTPADIGGVRVPLQRMEKAL